MIPPKTHCAKSGDIHIAGSGLSFRDRGRHSLNGLPAPLQLFAAEV
jgi:hypothetical protein